MKYILQVISLVYLLLVNISAKAETLDCTAIASLPTVITTQGIYCLTGNLSVSMTSGNAIEIQTNNVTIDMNGFKLGGLAAGSGTQATGIFATHRKNITIKNGIVRGFTRAIYLHDASPYTTSSGHVIKNILADNNTWTGIDVRGLGNVVKDNNVVETGGSTLINNAFGIVVYGTGAKVVGNSISSTTGQGGGSAYGIWLYSADYSLVANNTVTNTIHDTGTSRAINISSSTGILVRNNNLANAVSGIFFGSSTGKYFNNLTFDVTTPFTGGTPIGSNNN